MIRVCLLLMLVLTARATSGTRRGLPAREPRCPQVPQVAAGKIETTYDSSKDRTTVRLAPVQISAEKDKYHSLHMSPSFSFPGRQPERPAIVDFELQTIVKARLLDSDLYVVFIVDGETIHLSSNRWAILRPIPGRRWIGERLVFRMPNETFVKITKAKELEIKFDGVKFEIGKPPMQALREFASRMN